jgi:hypothetical protein
VIRGNGRRRSGRATFSADDEVLYLFDIDLTDRRSHVCGFPSIDSRFIADEYVLVIRSEVGAAWSQEREAKNLRVVYREAELWVVVNDHVVAYDSDIQGLSSAQPGLRLAPFGDDEIVGEFTSFTIRDLADGF